MTPVFAQFHKSLFISQILLDVASGINTALTTSAVYYFAKNRRESKIKSLDSQRESERLLLHNQDEPDSWIKQKLC